MYELMGENRFVAAWATDVGFCCGFVLLAAIGVLYIAPASAGSGARHACLCTATSVNGYWLSCSCATLASRGTHLPARRYPAGQVLPERHQHWRRIPHDEGPCRARLVHVTRRPTTQSVATQGSPCPLTEFGGLAVPHRQGFRRFLQRRRRPLRRQGRVRLLAPLSCSTCLTCMQQCLLGHGLRLIAARS